MKLSKFRLSQFAIYIAFFILFSGYYVGLIIWSNTGGGSSRTLTVPLRLVILLFLGFTFLLKDKLSFSFSVKLFLFFSTVYFLRIFIEMLTGGNNFHITETQFLMYYSGFVFFPFLIISQTKFDDKSYQKMFNAIIFSTLILSFLTFIYYRSLIGNVGRISQAISRDDNYISPLSLSYTGAIGIGIGTIYLVTNKKIKKKQKYLILATIILSAIPFFLGASRGSIIALALPFILMVYKTKSFKNKFYITFIAIVAGVLIVIFSEKFGSGLIARFANIQSDIESGNSSAARLIMWFDSFQQFWGKSYIGQ